VTAWLVENDSRLDGRLVPDALERLAVLLELEHLVDDPLGLDLARVEVVDCLGLFTYYCQFWLPSVLGGLFGGWIWGLLLDVLGEGWWVVLGEGRSG